jgi:hypothetical protein
MKLAKVYPQTPKFRAACIRCGMPHDSDKLLADLDGIPFRAYYCDPCAQIRLAERESAGYSNAPIIGRSA